MLTRNDQPEGFALDFATDSNFNFAVDSIFINGKNNFSVSLPPGGNNYNLLDGTDYLILDGSNYKLL